MFFLFHSEYFCFSSVRKVQKDLFLTSVVSILSVPHPLFHLFFFFHLVSWLKQTDELLILLTPLFTFAEAQEEEEEEKEEEREGSNSSEARSRETLHDVLKVSLFQKEEGKEKKERKKERVSDHGEAK